MADTRSPPGLGGYSGEHNPGCMVLAERAGRISVRRSECERREIWSTGRSQGQVS